jgi:hypothetical protein
LLFAVPEENAFIKNNAERSGNIVKEAIGAIWPKKKALQLNVLHARDLNCGTPDIPATSGKVAKRSPHINCTVYLYSLPVNMYLSVLWYRGRAMKPPWKILN